MQNSTAKAYESSSSSGNGNNDAGDFECNICFELAQDPIVTLCGHLYCWPCLYRWLRLHSQCHECPVCKALIQEEKLVPLYGRGRTSTDPRSKPVPGVEIPRRPAGQRPETAPAPESNTFPNPAFGLVGGFFPGASASFGNFTMSAGVGGLFPSLFSFQFNGFPGPTAFGATPNYAYGYPPVYRGANVHNAAQSTLSQADNNLKFMFLLVGFLVFLYLFGY